MLREGTGADERDAVARDITVTCSVMMTLVLPKKGTHSVSRSGHRWNVPGASMVRLLVEALL